MSKLTRPTTFGSTHESYILHDVMFPSVEHIGKLSGMIMKEGTIVNVASWYQGYSASSIKPTGGGLFKYDSSVERVNHNGGTVISPTVPSHAVNLEDYINGVGDTSPNSYGCWVRIAYNEIDGAMFGLSNYDVDVEATSSLKKMVAVAATVGMGIKLPPANIILREPISVPMHQRTGGLVKYFIGSGEKLTKINILADATSSINYGITFEGSLSVDTTFEVKDFLLQGVESDKSVSDWKGYGIKFNKVIRLDFKRCYIRNLNVATNFTDTLYVTCDTLRFNYVMTAMQGRLGEVTGTNLVNLKRCDFINCGMHCIEMQHSHAWTIDSCSFEGNGGKAKLDGTPISFLSCIQFAQIGGAGVVAAKITGCYFENNTGSDVSFYINRNLNQTLSIVDSIFNYDSSKVTASRILVHTNQADLGSGVVATLDLRGNGFLQIGTTESAFREIQFAVPNTFKVSHLRLIDIGNKFVKTDYVLGVEKVERVTGGASARCYVNSIGTSSQNLNVKTSKVGTGTYLLEFPMSVVDKVPNVTMSGAGRYCTFERTSDYSITVTTHNSTGAVIDLDFYFTM